MKVKTADLSDAVLDWAVAKAQGRTEIKIFSRARPTDRGWIEVRFNPEPKAATARFDPSEDWALGGPILDLEEITIDYRDNETQARKWSNEKNAFITTFAGKKQGLIAAMRCFVASKLGDEIEIPEELLK